MWPTIRAFAGRVYDKECRETQGAGAVVHAAAPANGFNDQENHDTCPTSGGAAFQATKFPQVNSSASANEPSAAVDVVKERQISIFTVLKIVSGNARA